MNVLISTTFTFFICFSVFSQKEPKVKEINYHFEFNSMDFIGEYDGEVLRMEIDEKKRKTPVGYGVFKGKYKGLDNVDLWIVYNGNWLNGKLEGRGTFITLSTKKGIKPDWSEIDSIFTDSSRELPKSINEYYLGRFSSNFFIGDSSTIKSVNYEYYGDVVNWLPHGNGKKIKNDTLVISSIPMIIKEYEGVFSDGKFENGIIRLLGEDELKGDLKDGVFSGEAKLTFTNNFSITLADALFQAVSYFGKIKNNKFDNGIIRLSGGDQLKGDLKDGLFTGDAKLTFTNNLSIKLADALFQAVSYNGKIINNTFESGQITFKSGEVLTGDWKNNLFTGKGKLNVEGKYSYEGDWDKGTIHGKGKKVINDTLIIESVLILVEEYEGGFTNGKFENGTIRIAENGELKGIVNDGKFSGEGNITFQKSLAISLAKNACEAVSYNGKITDSKFDNGQIKLKSGEILTGTLTNNMFTGKGPLSIGDKYLYEGDWLEGDIHGSGKITKKNEWAYSGSFDKNQLVGSGELMYFIGNTYVSNFQGKLDEGQIDITLANNEKLKISYLDYELEGVIIDNTLIGFGELNYNNTVYKGSFSMPFDADRIDEKSYSDEIKTARITSGEGRLTYSNGDTLHVRLDKDGSIGTGRVNFGFTENGDSLYLEGTFRNGLLDGTGKKCFMYKLYKDDEQEYYMTYTGQFQGGAMHGKGVLYGMMEGYGMADGLWEDGMNGGLDVSMDGNWINNAFTKGTMVEKTLSEVYFYETTYTGEFLNNQIIGQGVLKSDEGTYTGNFTDGIPNGNGKYVYDDGSIYEGEFHVGMPYGNGKYVYADGRIYEGEMKDGSPNGVGKMTLKSKQVLSGKFIYGEYQKPFSCKEVKIGDQIWMAENLNVAKFRNGDLIPEARSKEEWVNAGLNNKPAFCYVNNDPSTTQKYGILYNWYAVRDSRGLAPEGWRIPSHTDIFELRGFTQKDVYDLQNKILKMKNDGLSSELIKQEQIKLDKYFLTVSCDLGGVRLYSVGQCFEYLNNDPAILKYCGYNKYGFNGKNEAYRDSDGKFVLPSPYSLTTFSTGVNGAIYWSSSSVGGNGFVLEIKGRAGPINSYDKFTNRAFGDFDHWLYNIDNQSKNPIDGYPIRCLKN